jgi:tetratricopeptide (TPR) repeat protein
MLADLAATPFAGILWRVATDRSSGDLQVRSGKIVKTAFFDHGRLVFAASNLKRDRLGEALVALGRITSDQYDKASALMAADRKRRFGEALVEAGVLDKNELGTSVARQVRRVVLSLFELPEGVAAFEERRCAIPLEYMVSVSVHHLLYDGIRLMKDRELVLHGLGNLDRWITIGEVPPFRFELEDCSPEEVEILEHSRRRATIRRLAWAPGGPSFQRLKAVYALLSSGVLRDAEGEPAAERQPIIQMDTGTFLLSALRRQPDPSSRESIRLEVDEELHRSSKMDRETWLRVSQTAPREELARALEEKMERYHALLDAVGSDQDLKTDIEVILGRASAMLRLTLQTQAAPPKPAARPAAAPPVAKPEPPPLPTPEEPPAPSTAAAPEGAPEAAPPGAAGAATGGMRGSAQIEHLLMEGEVRMTVSDYANAVKVFGALVDLAPRVGAYRARLAIAMACWPRTAKQAEREFLEAMRLEPDNVDYHYQFGLYYKAMKLRGRAIAEFRTTLGLNPRHKLAREELETLSPKDSALTTLKKLFK